MRELKLLFEADYARYRRTKHWRELRARVKRRAGGRCERCGETRSLDAHHVSYEHVGEEPLSDMLTLCRACHRAQHQKLDLNGCVLRNQHGDIVGFVTEIVVEFVGTFKEGSSCLEEKEQLPQEETNQKDGSLREGNNEPEVERVWARYCDAFEPRDPRLHADERKIIRAALKVATVDECLMAIKGCKASPFHMGDNDRHKSYNRISHILRGKQGKRTTREQIDLFIEIAEKPGSVEHHDPRISRAMADVRQAVTYPDNRPVRERGARGREVLENAGWTIIETPDGHVSFERR